MDHLCEAIYFLLASSDTFTERPNNFNYTFASNH